MRKFLCRISLIITFTVIILMFLFVSIVEFMGTGFADTYQSVITRKYDQLVSIEEPKIIIIAGSSSGFGVNEELLKEETGYEVVNLGLHAGFGMNFPTQLSKANINEDDIVVLAYEYGWQNSDASSHCGVDLVMSRIDNHISLYKYIRPQNYDDIINYFFNFAVKKATRMTNKDVMEGTYSAASFNEKGHMILDRPESFMSDEYDRSAYGSVNVDTFSIYEESKKYILNYKEFVDKKGAKLFFTAPPIMKSANESEIDRYIEMVNIIEDELNIDFISDPINYFFDSEYMFDTIYHLNNEGEKQRTLKLADDINNAIIDLTSTR